VEALLVDLYLRPSGALAALVYTRGTGPSAVLVNGLAAIGGVHEAAECEGFDGFDPSCAPAGCAAILATPVTDACDCLTARTLCFGTEPAPAQTGLFWRDVDGVREVFAASVELAAETSWNVCTPGDAPACACEGACG